MRAAYLAVLVAGAGLLSARSANATPYETFIDIADQSDLEDLLASQDISQDTYDALLDLMSRGVDLNQADRAALYALPNLTYEDVDKILAYRSLNQGVIHDPADLVTAGALSQDKLLAIASFLVVTEVRKDPLALHGWLRAMTRMTVSDRIAPPFMLHMRINGMKHMEAGLALTTSRLRIGAPTYDPNRDALIAENRALRAHIAKVFLEWETDQYALIGGDFRAGFAQRLVFDNSANYTPNGLYHDDEVFYATDLAALCRETDGELTSSPCEGAAGNKYVTPDFTWRQGLFGVGVGAKKLELGAPGWGQFYAWASAARRSIYQYELFDHRTCDDPHDDSATCSAPTIYVRPQGDLLTPTSRFTFTTLPDVFVEKLAGANATYFADRRNSVGATMFVAQETDLIDGVDLDFQEWSRFPIGRTFGAAGANVAFGRRWLDVFAEAAYSYDKMPTAAPAQGGGGPAGIVRVTATRPREELEAVLRYYSTDYANPYARPISQSDEFEGQRARDELGARLRYLNNGTLFQLHALVDLWVPPSTLKDDPASNPLGRVQPKLDTYVRGDVRSTHELKLGLLLRYQDKDLQRGGHDQCFEVSTATSETGEPVPCGGRQLTSTAHAAYQVDRQLAFTVMLEHQLLDDRAASDTSWRSDVAAWLIGLWNPQPGVRIRGRVRYLDEAIESNKYLERSISGLVDGAFRVRDRDSVRLRIDIKSWLDKRLSTRAREPDPEVQLWLSYEARL